MNIAITINDVIREFSETVRLCYESHMESKNPEEPQEIFQMEDTLEKEDELNYTEVSNQNPTGTSIDELDIANDLMGISYKYPFDTVEEYNTFLWSDYTYSIFGKTEKVYAKVVDDFLLFYKKLTDEGHKVTLVSQEVNNSKIATFMFLAYNKVKVNNVKFVYNYSNIWSNFDCIITANPYIYKHSGNTHIKKCYFIESPINKNLGVEKTYKNINEVSKAWSQLTKNN